MILRRDIEEACSTKKIADCDDDELYSEVFIAVNSYATRMGEALIDEAFLPKTVYLMCDDLRKMYGHLHMGEACLAMRTTELSLDLRYRRTCTDTFRHMIEAYVQSTERKSYKEGSEAKMLPAPSRMPTDKERQLMEALWKRVCEAERKGKLYSDPGNCLFEYMHSLGKLDVDEADIEDAVEYHEHFASLTDAECGTGTKGVQRSMSRDALKAYKNKDNTLIMPMAKKFALRRARREQIMEIEAAKIKQNEPK